MNIKNVPIEQIIPYINNPRHNENAIDKVASSIAEFGFKVPAIIDKNNVLVTGHTRVLAAKKLGLKEIPCIVADDLTDAQIKAFRIADNKVSEFATWDEELLKLELEQLQERDFSLELTGFNLEEIHKLLDVVEDDDLIIPDYEDDEEEEEYEEEEDGKAEGIIQYNIIFNNKKEQETWHEFVVYLKSKYPHAETISERLTLEIGELLNE